MALFSNGFNLCAQFLKLSLKQNVQIVRHRVRKPATPKERFPEYFVKEQRVIHDDFITFDNRQFISEVVQERLKATAKLNNEVTYKDSPLSTVIPKYGEWSPGMLRTGLIARKLGSYPMWTDKGKKMCVTLLQIADNHVVKYIPPEEVVEKNKKQPMVKNKRGCLLVGAETIDPSLLTKEYCGIFNKSGVLPKKILARFFISPQAALPSGTPLYVSHFRVGDHLDIRGLTVDRGFQGVMKRWGFKGMPATHGVTKTHRRPGNIGGGGEKGRVWPGTKLPGHMGNRWRIHRGAQIIRINTKHNLLWVHTSSIPGLTNNICYIYDTILPLKKFYNNAPPFPTYIPTGEEPEEMYMEKIHMFENPTITFSE